MDGNQGLLVGAWSVGFQGKALGADSINLDK